MEKMRFGEIANALEELMATSWPTDSIPKRLEQVSESRNHLEMRGATVGLFALVHHQHPNAHFWIKDEESRFLDACPNFVRASGVGRIVLLSGINDLDPRLPWTRQAPVYLRDDQLVLTSQAPKLNIVERQDRGDTTCWLKTSKVPYLCKSSGSGGTVGGFEEISSAEAQDLLRRAQRNAS